MPKGTAKQPKTRRTNGRVKTTKVDPRVWTGFPFQPTREGRHRRTQHIAISIFVNNNIL